MYSIGSAGMDWISCRARVHANADIDVYMNVVLMSLDLVSMYIQF